jgi:hypothetical protein
MVIPLKNIAGDNQYQLGARANIKGRKVKNPVPIR